MKIVDIPAPKMEKWQEAAAYLRSAAERVERGDISELVIVMNDREENAFASWGMFEDRWRLLGALEYAKGGVR